MKKEPRATGDEELLDLAEALGATQETSTQALSLYIPNKDRDGHEFGTQHKWVLEAAALLARIGGGVTIMPPAEGGWVNEQGAIIWEHPVVVYTYIKPDAFLAELPALRRFVHRLGRETNQGEVVVELAGAFFRIRRFDKAKGGTR